jgi:hypothetical protein
VQRKSKFVARFRIQDESVSSWGDLRLITVLLFATFLTMLRQCIHFTCKNCSGSTSYWASRIRNYLYGSGSRSESFHQRAEKLRKTFFPTVL